MNSSSVIIAFFLFYLFFVLPSYIGYWAWISIGIGPSISLAVAGAILIPYWFWHIFTKMVEITDLGIIIYCGIVPAISFVIIYVFIELGDKSREQTEQDIQG